MTSPAPTTSLELWPDGPPDGLLQHGQPAYTEAGPGPGNRDILRTHLVSRPCLTLYQPPQGNPSGAAVVVFPGGGYRILAIQHEGTEVAQWLNSLGIAAIVAEYRTSPADATWPPQPGQLEEVLAATLADAQRALRIVRSQAQAWQIDPRRVGVLGFSAGGNLALRLACAGDDSLDSPDGSARPDFSVLAYPAVMRGVPEIPAGMGPTFILNAGDDTLTPVAGAIQLYQALTARDVPAELHVFPTGGHGFGLGAYSGPVDQWPALCARWLQSLWPQPAPQKEAV